MKKYTKLENKQRTTPFLIVASVIICIYCVSLILPLVWVIFSCFKFNPDFIKNPFGLPKFGFTWTNFGAISKIGVQLTSAEGIRIVGVAEMFLYSIIYAVGVSFVANFSRCVCAYIAAKYRHLRWPVFLHAFVVFLMTFSFPSNLAVTIKFYKMMRMYDNLAMCLITSVAFGGANFLYFYAAFVGVSNEYAEAASLDGAGRFTIMFRIIMPMIKNIFIALFMLEFITHWNDYNPSLIFLPSYPMLAYGLWRFQYQKTPSIPVLQQMATTVVVIVPTLTVFILFKDKIVSNLAIGGLKG